MRLSQGVARNVLVRCGKDARFGDTGHLLFQYFQASVAKTVEDGSAQVSNLVSQIAVLG